METTGQTEIIFVSLRMCHSNFEARAGSYIFITGEEPGPLRTPELAVEIT